MSSRPGAVVGVVGAAFLANAFFNHTDPGLALKASARGYVLLFYVPFGVVLPALLFGRLGSVHAAGVVRKPFGRADLVGVPVALLLAAALVAFPLAPILADADGWKTVHRLFALLLIASLSEVMLFLGVVGNSVVAALRQAGHGRLSSSAIALIVSCVLFGLFHFTYPSPWNTSATVLLLSGVWVGVSLVFFATQSLLAAVVFNNAMALVGFVERDLAIPGSAGEGWARGVLAVLVVAFLARPSGSNRSPD